MINWKHVIIYWSDSSTDGIVYSPDLGELKTIELDESAYGPSIWIGTTEAIVSLGGKSSFARIKSCTLLGISEESVIKEIQRQNDLLKKKIPEAKIDSDGYATDPRIVRLYILYWYEEAQNWSSEKLKYTFEQKLETLKDGITWSLPDAREWLIRNKIRVPKEPDGFEDFDENSPKSLIKYLCDPSKLVEPYWRP